MAADAVKRERLIAIVDDDASVRQSLLRLVRSLGFRANAFGSAEDFLGSDAATSTTCLILDVRMPGMDGLELQRRLVAQGSKVAIVFLTALASDDEERRAREAGAVEILHKPAGRDALLHALDVAFATRTGGRGDRS